jgi:hypothetical protein
MKTAMLTLAALLSLAPIPALAQAQTGDTAYEKKSYNYAEWAKGRFSEVVTVRNPGKIIYLGGVGSEDASRRLRRPVPLCVGQNQAAIGKARRDARERRQGHDLRYRHPLFL